MSSKYYIYSVAAFLCIFVLSTQGVGGASIQDKIRDAENRIKELQQKAEEYQGVIHSHEHEAHNLSEKISEFEAEIDHLKNEISINETKLERTELSIEQTTIEINESEALIAKGKTQITELLREMQKERDKNFMEIVLENDSLSDFLHEVQMHNTLQEEIGDRLDALNILKQDLEGKREQLLLDEAAIVEMQNNLGDQRYILNQEQKRQENLLYKTRNSQRNYENLLSEIEKEEQQLRGEIFQLEQELRRQLDPSSLPSGIFYWPTSGTVTQQYGCIHTKFARTYYPPCNNGQGGFHNGLDIGAPLGTQMYAVEDGTVVANSSSSRGYGLWVAIKQTNGIVTVYAHLSKLNVSNGQQVSKGDVIALMGSTGFSTGSHLHFIVYAPGTFRVVTSRSTGALVPVGATVSPSNYLPHLPVGARIPI